MTNLLLGKDPNKSYKTKSRQIVPYMSNKGHANAWKGGNNNPNLKRQDNRATGCVRDQPWLSVVS